MILLMQESRCEERPPRGATKLIKTNRKPTEQMQDMKSFAETS